MLYAFRASFVGLVDMDLLDRAVEGLRATGMVGDSLISGLATDGVVEDENLGGAGAGTVVSVWGFILAQY